MMKADPLPNSTSPYGSSPQIIKTRSPATIVPEIAPLALPKIIRPTEGVLSPNALQIGSATGTEIASSETSERFAANLKGAFAKPAHNKNQQRKDRKGVIIDRSRKAHRVTFRDEVKGAKLVDVLEVESYKEHNRIGGDQTTGCSCALL